MKCIEPGTATTSRKCDYWLAVAGTSAFAANTTVSTALFLDLAPRPAWQAKPWPNRWSLVLRHEAEHQQRDGNQRKSALRDRGPGLIG
jgi:hypothetical protein